MILGKDSQVDASGYKSYKCLLHRPEWMRLKNAEDIHPQLQEAQDPKLVQSNLVRARSLPSPLAPTIGWKEHLQNGLLQKLDWSNPLIGSTSLMLSNLCNLTRSKWMLPYASAHARTSLPLAGRPGEMVWQPSDHADRIIKNCRTCSILQNVLLWGNCSRLRVC